MDPPPVVELHVYEGPSWENKKDITFHYNANFFIFATLEHARVMAHGRVQTPAANAPPVLSGMPVAGMAYLDRPNEAGYFLFPDLSVRHEGRYRLTFALYEETKEDKDKDQVSPEDPPTDECPNGSFDYRMSVQCSDFTAYSAKKFPGLTESTPLSRMVAEQGCRVRIRRDVRMRRREGKGTGDHEIEDIYPRMRTATPESIRARSLSNHSVERTPYGVDSQRRPSMDYPPPLLPAQSPTGPTGHCLNFGNQPTPQYPQYSSKPQPPSVPASPSYPTSTYHPANSYTTAPPGPVPPQSRPYSVAGREMVRETPPPPPPGSEYRRHVDNPPPLLTTMCKIDGEAPSLPPLRDQGLLTIPDSRIDPQLRVQPHVNRCQDLPRGRPGELISCVLPPQPPPPIAQWRPRKRLHDEVQGSFERSFDTPRFTNGARDGYAYVGSAREFKAIIYPRASGQIVQTWTCERD